jgi:mono/diheme cytochrome c family protein
MRLRTLLVLPLLLAAAAGPCAWLFGRADRAPAQNAAVDAPAASDFATAGVPFLTKHCVACHGATKKRADLALHVYRDEASVLKDRKRWETVLKMVQAGEMPPPSRKRPAPAEAEAFVRSVHAVFERADRTTRRDPGHITIRRLNRIEYNNTIRDLVGVDFDPAEDFPADDVGYGFDNIGDVLSLSPILMERYLAAAEAIVARAVLTEPPPPPSRRVASQFLQPRAFRQARARGLYARGDTVYTSHTLTDTGEYVLRVRGGAVPDGKEPARFALLVDDREVKAFEVKESARQGTYEAHVNLDPGSHRVVVKMLSDFKAPETPPDFTSRDRRPPGVFVGAVELEGPLGWLPESHRRIMACTSGKSPREQAHEILSRFVCRAYRRPAAPDEIDRLLQLYDASRARGDKFEASIQLALEAGLVSPKFLFRVELDDRPDSKDTHPIDEYQLASRLAYFLWSTMPDDELSSLAARKQLTANLEAQVRRMLKDPKAKALVENFGMQWLQLRNLKTVAPDRKLFPEFDDRLRAAMLEETELFFEAIVREDRSILDLLDGDFTYVNGRLARHYGISGVYGDEFQRVSLAGSQRGGLLTQASILTVTSNPTRTSPVKRGKWVLEQVLGTPPPPPPPNVPELATDAKAQLTGSLRQRMEQHRANPSCAVCHNNMDALGFAFENFDAVGAFRARDGTFPIDPSGTLPTGQSFQGPAELKAILKGKKELFSRCLTEKMLTYALGRGVESYDRATVEAINAALARNNYRFSTLVLESVKSEPFRLRRGKDGQQ